MMVVYRRLFIAKALVHTCVPKVGPGVDGGAHSTGASTGTWLGPGELAKDSFFPSAAQRPKEHWGMRAATWTRKRVGQMLSVLTPYQAP